MSTFKRLRTTLPNVDIQIVPEATRDPLPALLDRTLDVAIVFSLPEDPRVVTHESYRDELVGVVPDGHPLARKAFLCAHDFESETMVCHYAEPNRSVFDREVLHPAGIRPQRVLEMQVTVAVLEMVRAGLGVTVLPCWALPPGRALGKLRVVRVTKKGLFRTWHAAVLRDQASRPATATLIQLLVEETSHPRRRLTSRSTRQ